eukprot:Seg2189.3 transcript_id=Seg2189.3/GoldUCD/mRNA.D3Y31 product="hypothetical protein" protein_id=Seg2189.3/GoldUCD/D3Y31
MADEEDTKAEQEVEEAINPDDDNEEGNDDQEKEKEVDLEDPYIGAIDYLEKNHIVDVFQSITAQIVHQRPENPLQFMLEELEKQQKESEDV